MRARNPISRARRKRVSRTEPIYMDASTDTVAAEVIGIVISMGHREERETRFSAYVWGPAPEADPEPKSKVA